VGSEILLQEVAHSGFQRCQMGGVLTFSPECTLAMSLIE
jgi:hypothetical protein